MMYFKNEPEFCEKATFMKCCFSHINRLFRTSGTSNWITSTECDVFGKTKRDFSKRKLENILSICLFLIHVVFLLQEVDLQKSNCF